VAVRGTAEEVAGEARDGRLGIDEDAAFLRARIA
jgi:hypothetical protein